MQKKKPHQVVTIPEIKTLIYQPNCITNARYHYTLHQERLFTYVMLYLQHYTKRLLKGEQIEQLEIFSNEISDVRIVIPLDYIVKSPAQYNEVRASAKSLASIVVKIPYTDKEGKKWEEYTGLMSVHTPTAQETRTKNLVVTIKKSVARMLVDLDRKDNRIPQNFTTFIFEVAMEATNKYTSRLYKYISSWKGKGLVSPDPKLEDIKAMLGIEHQYSNYSDFKKRVLIPVMEELKHKADCWFDCEEDGFEVKTNTKVTALHIRVQTADKYLTECKLWNNVWHLLRTYFKLNDQQIAALAVIEKSSVEAVTYKILDLYDRTRNNRDITDPKAYAIKVLLKEFA